MTRAEPGEQMRGQAGPMDEEKLIERIRRWLPARAGGGLRLGIGDDAAVLRPEAGKELLWTCDFFLEGVHFLREKHPPEVVGYKALARATSDIAALGGRARWFLLSLALPATHTGRWLDGFLAGMRRAAGRFGMQVAGGDTTRNRQIVVSVTVLGEIARGRAVMRRDARPGDLIFVSGRLGRAQLGLELVLRGWDRRRKWKQLLRRHFYPQPRLALGEWLASHGAASAMIDLSDGLSTDLRHLCEASGVGAQVYAERIPAVRVPEALRKRGIEPLQLALDGGEDYELLFTVSRGRAGRLPQRFRGLKISRIGEVTRGTGVRLFGTDGRARVLGAGGWDAFRVRNEAAAREERKKREGFAPLPFSRRNSPRVRT